MIAFDDTKLCYRSEIGATAEGTSLRLRVLLPRAFGVFACTLVLFRDGSDTQYIPMTWESTDGESEWWRTELAPVQGLYFYHFTYETAWGVSVLKKQKYARQGGLDGTQDWQWTVYDAAYRTPDRFKGGVIYQIFPDRFYASGEKKQNVPRDRVLHADKTELPVYRPNAGGRIVNNDYFGGDLRGIEQKLPYIAELGADTIYLNPIFEAHSNHRYNTADYMKIDPLLGTEADFVSLCNAAHARGIKILLDGVFSHTGDDSVYFNKRGRYKGPGAYQSEASPYYQWYRFHGCRDAYDCWWNIDTLPEVNEEEPSYEAFITGEGGVIDKWLGLGADGFRLDVADELPDGFLDAVRRAVKRNGEEKLLLGEVWEDASNKISHGGRRRYFWGRQLDGVMNYPFRTAILDFLLTADAPRFMDAVYEIVLNYPAPAMACCMNPLGTHDTERILTALAGIRCEGMPRELQAELTYTPYQIAHAKRLLRMAAAINTALPGIPAIYYGDETGMFGAKDPFNRGYFPWGREDPALFACCRFLCGVRRHYPVLREGGFYPLSAALGCAAFLRYSPGEKRLAVIANKNPTEIVYDLNEDMHGMACISGGQRLAGAVRIPPETAAILADE